MATLYSTRQQNYYSVLLHELVHWTGHPSRENRNGPFEEFRENYAFEELVAELGAAFLCSEFELEDVPRKNHAQYLNHWLQFIGERPELLWRASSLAQQAMTFLLETETAEPESDNSSPGWLQAQPTQVDLLSPMSLNIAGQ
ncbi:MAG: zincin-like metallopeptidase domain-containing protein [Xanthomonadales bacterium]|nr:zincin-like metallopeptidase domain-containing protein [Xanthomonadales bacterium]